MEQKEYVKEIKEAMEARSLARQRVQSPKPETDLPENATSDQPPTSKSPTNKSQASKSPTNKSPQAQLSDAKGPSPTRTNRSAKSGASSVSSQRVKSRVQLDERGLRYINLSTQGIPAVPKSIFTHKDVGTLNLSGNNLREIPKEIYELKTLFKLDLSRNGIRCMHSQDFKGLPAEMAQLKKLEILILSECNFAFIPPVVWQLESLKYLNISRNKINLLVPEVGNLNNLKTLDIRQANLNSLPSEIAYCQELEEILLWGNTIERLPETLKDLPCLKKLALNCRSFAAIVEQMDGMEEMLRTGERTSGYIPPVLFELSCLNVLDLGETKINWLPDTCQAKLTEFYLNKNFFRTVPQMVHTIATLQVLDLSNNFITELPDEINSLEHLTTFRINNNSLEIIPMKLCKLKYLAELSVGGNRLKEIPEQIGQLTNLHTLILDRNKLTSLPDSITKLENLETLDLTDNLLECLPVSFHTMKLQKAHGYNKYSKYGLWLHKNPLKTPPESVWKTEDPEQIYNYLRKLEIRLTENLQLQRLIVMGDWQSGKSSLIQTMIMEKSVLQKELTDSTSVMDYTLWTTDNLVKFNVTELGGLATYSTLHPLFMDTKAMYLVIYDHASINEQNFTQEIAQWLDLVGLFAPMAIVKLVGTKCDQCSEEVNEAKLALVKEKLVEYQQSKRENLKAEITKRESQLAKHRNNKEDNMTKLLFKQLRKLEAMLRDSLRIEAEINLVSSNSGIPGINNLVCDLELLAVNKNLFPHAQRFIPDYWKEFSSELKTQKGSYLTWKQVSTVGRRHEMRNELLTACMEFLTDTGEILWFSNNEALKEIVFHRPRDLVQILRCIYRHDKSPFFKFQNRIWQHAGHFSKETFSQAKNAFFKWGQASRDMLIGLSFHLKIDNKLELLADILPKLDVCYVVPQADIPPKKGVFVPLMVIPSNNVDISDSTEADSLINSSDDDHKEVNIVFHFPTISPSGLFEKFACRLQGLLDSRIDWKNVIFGEVGSTKIFVKSIQKANERLIKMIFKGRDSDMIQICCSFLCQNFYNLMSDCPGLIWYFDYNARNDAKIKIEEWFPTGLFEIETIEDYRQTPKSNRDSQK